MNKPFTRSSACTSVCMGKLVSSINEQEQKEPKKKYPKRTCSCSSPFQFLHFAKPENFPLFFFSHRGLAFNLGNLSRRATEVDAQGDDFFPLIHSRHGTLFSLTWPILLTFPLRAHGTMLSRDIQNETQGNIFSLDFVSWSNFFLYSAPSLTKAIDW